MMNYKISIPIWLLFTFGSMIVFAANPTQEKQLAKENIFQLKRNVEEEKRKLNQISLEIKKIENTLGMHNKKYLNSSKDRVYLEEIINSSTKNLEIDSANLMKSELETKKVLMGLILNKLEKNETSSDLLARKVLIGDLQKRLMEYQTLKEVNAKLNLELNGLKEKLDSALKVETELVQIMADLENKKKELFEERESKSQTLNIKDREFTSSKNKLAMEEKALMRESQRKAILPLSQTEEIKVSEAVENRLEKSADFISPMLVHNGYNYKEKGITFKFQGKHNVVAARAGKVNFVGPLANYGNVVMIDHGQETRSVIFGQFEYLVKVGDQVKESQIIGQTAPKMLNGIADGNIYFEVRKNNRAQNTYLLVDKFSLSKRQ